MINASGSGTVVNWILDNQEKDKFETEDCSSCNIEEDQLSDLETKISMLTMIIKQKNADYQLILVDKQYEDLFLEE